jgi:hypothetical protein
MGELFKIFENDEQIQEIRVDTRRLEGQHPGDQRLIEAARAGGERARVPDHRREVRALAQKTRDFGDDRDEIASSAGLRDG